MNIKLLPNDINVDFTFFPPEIYKSNDDIKLISFNSEGSIVLIVTKANEIRIFDFLGKSVLFKITYFIENQMKIISISWTKDSNNAYITYEKGDITGFQRIDFNFFDLTIPPYSIPQNDQSNNDITISFQSTHFSIKDVKVYSYSKDNKNFLYISGTNPAIINIEKKEIIYFINQEGYRSNKNNTIIVKEAAFYDCYYLIVKELYLILYIKPKLANKRNINTSKLSYEQIIKMQFINSSLHNNYMLYDVFALMINGEITSVQLNEIQSLMLVNSSDRVLRLYRIVDEMINLQKDYSDSVNKKRWINSYFYTNKIKRGFQDLIITGLCDSNSLEFTFIEIETGKILKKLEPFKYSVQDFVCHYKNHFSLLLASNKKLFNITGFMINQWGCFAPGLKYIEENIDFIEDESFFDKFEDKMRENIKRETRKEEKIPDCFIKTEKRKNIFFKLRLKEENGDNVEKEKSYSELKELFNYLNEEIDDNKKI